LIVVGLGLNVTLRATEVASPAATSLLELGVAAPDRDRLVRRLLDDLATRIAQWRDTGGSDAKLMGDYLARSLTVGSRVRAILPGDREIVGVARAVDEQGRLRIETYGRSATVTAGDVTHLRADRGGGG
jgi:BirA family biotin operon repressor/biotin-[acetyl-CoA-carboxylase] ligase